LRASASALAARELDTRDSETAAAAHTHLLKHLDRDLSPLNEPREF